MNAARMKLLGGLLLCAGLLSCAAAPAAAVNWQGKGAQLLGEILTNPGAFFNDFQQDIEATHPLPPGKWFGVQTGIFPSLLPMTMANISGKVRLHPEGRLSPGLPQLDLIGGYWDMLGTRIAEKNASDDVNSANFKGSYIGAIVTSSLSPRVRLFWGYKYSQLKANLNLKKTVDILGTQVSSFESGYQDNYFMAGLEHPTGLNSLWSIQLNYGVRNKTIASKVSWYGKHFEWGLNIYPEGVLVIHPVLNYHMNF